MYIIACWNYFLPLADTSTNSGRMSILRSSRGVQWEAYDAAHCGNLTASSSSLLDMSVVIWWRRNQTLNKTWTCSTKLQDLCLGMDQWLTESCRPPSCISCVYAARQRLTLALEVSPSRVGTFSQQYGKTLVKKLSLPSPANYLTGKKSFSQ